jgi:hypothetical protein
VSSTDSFKGMTVAQVLEQLSQHGIHDLHDLVREALREAFEAAEKDDDPAHAVAFIHPHFVLYHEEGVSHVVEPETGGRG